MAYSRRATVEETKNKRKGILYIFLTISVVVLLVFLGIPLIIRMAAFLGEFNKTNSPIEKSDVTPPAPPSFLNVEEYTNKKTIDIKGTSEPGATISIELNGIEDQTIADRNGDFSLTVKLLDGVNDLSAKAIDENGNESAVTQNFQITYDNVPPEIDFLAPNDGAQFYGSKEQKVLIEGKTEVDASLRINDRFVAVNPDGTFRYDVTLNEGDNNFVAVATDNAGNRSEEGITLHYWY